METYTLSPPPTQSLLELACCDPSELDRAPFTIVEGRCLVLGFVDLDAE